MTLSLHTSEAKDLIITHLLKHVPKLGWTPAALRCAVLDTGFEEQDAQRVFQGNVENALEYYLGLIDRQMEEKLTELNLSSMQTKDRIITAIMVRLRLVQEHKEAVRKSLVYLSVPTRSTLALRGLYNTVNAIWYAAGDRSTDFNFYTKRALLAGVYSAALLYWLEDSSEDSSATRAYVNRRLDQVMRIPAAKKRVTEAVKVFFKPFFS